MVQRHNVTSDCKRDGCRLNAAFNSAKMHRVSNSNDKWREMALCSHSPLTVGTLSVCLYTTYPPNLST